MVSFEPYHVHSCYSNCLTQPDSTYFIKDYTKVYRERGHKVLCLSEHGNRSNVWEQFDICESYKNDKTNPYTMTPIAAAEVYFVPDRKAEIDGKRDARNFHLILVAKNQEGFYELNEILSEANISGYYYHARVDFDLLGQLNYKNFMCTTACVAGICKDENYERLACQLGEIFRENFYLEVQHHPQEIQKETNMKILRLYQKYRWPLIYGTDSHYVNKSDKILRTELMLSKGISYGDEDSFDLHLPTAQEAYQLLLDQGILSRAQIEEAMENTLILREFEGVSFSKEKKIPNAYPGMTIEERNNLYKTTCMNEYIRKAGVPTEEEAKELQNEMDAVADTGTADYFLLCKRIVDKGREYGGVITKTGRGSGSSFATNFSLGFTSLNRLHSPVKLYPERFISKERMAAGILPDLDINLTNVEAFERAGQEILGQYGCLPMINYGTTKALSAFKLLAKARDLEFSLANEVSKQIKAYETDVKHAIENNADDPDYNVDDDVQIESYVEQKYLNLIEDSRKYKDIVLSVGPHPCAHLLLDKDIRREIGVIKIKGDKIVTYIDGTTADAYGYLKLDLLRVTVVEIIAKTFQRIGLPVMDVDELLAKIKDDEAVWNLYANGVTQGLNQCEQPKATERVMRYKPRNVVELSAYVAAIRPGFKSMLETFVSRTPFKYNIPSLDKLLASKEIPDSFLMYDEQVLSILISAGINAADAYVCLKGIKKKKFDKVEAFKEVFKEGYAKHLMQDEGATQKEAEKIVANVWGIIEASASYLFNASHSLCMGCDSLYVAWLKAHYPYELYATMLQIFSEKKNKDKIANIIAEMQRSQGIQITPGRFGQDNRDWLIDKENKTISQNLAGIRYISPQAAKELYELGKQDMAVIGTDYLPDVFTQDAKKRLAKLRKQLKPLQEKAEAFLNNGGDEFDAEFLDLYDQGMPLEQEIKRIKSDPASYAQRAKMVDRYGKLDCFTNVLRAIQMNTILDTRNIQILIGLNYFAKFGKAGKLMKVYEYFFNGDKKVSKTVKSFEARLENCRQYEASLEDSELPAGLRLRYELENIGLCLSTAPDAPTNAYFVTEIDDKYSIKVKLYSLVRGTTGTVKITKKDYKQPMMEGSCILIEHSQKRPKYAYNKGQRTVVPGEVDIWVTDYRVMQKGEANVA